MMAKIHPSWQLFSFLIGVILGTIFAIITRSRLFVSILWLFFSIAMLFFVLFSSRKIFVIFALISGFILAAYRGSLDLLGADQFSFYINQNATISGTVLDDPDSTENDIAFRLKDPKINDATFRGTIYVKTNSTVDLQRSDTVVLQGKIGEGFGTYLASVYRPELKEVIKSSSSDVFLQIRNFFADKVRNFIPSPASDIGLSYAVGMKSYLPSEISDKLKLVGLTHMVVASGTHLSILVDFARRLFGKVSRFCGFLFSLVFICAFLGIIGFTASMLRAALVSVLSLTAAYFGRNFHPLRLIVTVAAITLLISPSYLISPGWLLSFASFSGVLLLAPAITRIFYGEKEPNFFVNSLIVSLGATLSCLPLLIYFFGTFSLISIVPNLIILPTLPYVIGMIFLTGTASFVAPIATVVGKIVTFALNFHLYVVDFFSRQTIFIVEIAAENPLIFIFYVPIVAIIVFDLFKTTRAQPVNTKIAAQYDIIGE